MPRNYQKKRTTRRNGQKNKAYGNEDLQAAAESVRTNSLGLSSYWVAEVYGVPRGTFAHAASR